MKKAFIINGDFLCQNKMNGMQRYMREILIRLDRMLDDSLDVRVVISSDSDLFNIEFHKIKVVKLTGNKLFYSIFSIPFYVRKNHGIYCSMTNGFLGVPNSIVTVHDLIPTNKEAAYSLKSKLHIYLIYLSWKIFAGKIVTVSNRSKEEIERKLNLKVSEIIGNGYEHIEEIKADKAIFERIGLNHDYYYSLGSSYPYKNTRWVCELAKREKDKCFVIAGKLSESLLNKYRKLSNIIFTGYVSDNENKALMESCSGFIFPTKLEGFGIPALEALSLNKKVILSRASCLPEIYKESVYYIDPDNNHVKLEKIFKQKLSGRDEILKNNNWEKSARQWYKIIVKELH